MQADVRSVLAQLAGAKTLAPVPVVLIAFVSMPMALQRHPGEAAAAPDAHTTQGPVGRLPDPRR